MKSLRLCVPWLCDLLMANAPQRSRYSFSLRWLLRTFVVLSIVFAVARWCYVRVYTQARVVSELSSLDCSPEYSGYYRSVADGGPTWYGFGESRPNDFKNAVVGVRIGVPFEDEKDARRVNKLLRQLPYLQDVAAKHSERSRLAGAEAQQLADEHFAIAIAGLSVQGVDIDRGIDGGRTTEVLADIPTLRGVKIGHHNKFVAQLVRICSNPSLRRVRMFGSASQEQMEILAAATQLTHLELSNPPAESLPSVAHCELKIGSDQYTDEDLIEFVSKLPKLTALGLNGNRTITDEGVASLQHVSSLRELYLRDAIQITDAGIAPLAAIPELDRVNLTGTQVTEEGVITLCASKKIRDIYVPSQLDVDGLRKELPSVNVWTER